ncbi:MAG: hypothetical protein AAGJ85_02845, partial [Pseudomonadota bacterium]
MANIIINNDTTSSLTLGTNDNVYIGRNGSLVANTGIIGSGVNNLDVIIDGSLIALAGSAMRFTDVGPDLEISVGTTGRVLGAANAPTLQVNGTTTANLVLTNAGLMSNADSRVVNYEGSGRVSIVNSGDMLSGNFGGGEGTVIRSLGDLDVLNTGDMIGGDEVFVTVGDTDLSVVNGGAIAGLVFTSAQGDVRVSNTGSISTESAFIIDGGGTDPEQKYEIENAGLMSIGG